MQYGGGGGGEGCSRAHELKQLHVYSLRQTVPIQPSATRDSCVKHHARTHSPRSSWKTRTEGVLQQEEEEEEEVHSLLSAFSLCQEVVGAVERERCCGARLGRRSPERRDGDAGTESSADACGGSERESERGGEARSGLTVQR